MTKGIKEINEVFDGLELLAKTGGKAYADKEFTVADLPLLIDLAVNAKVLMDAFSGLSEIEAEAKDLDGAEQLALINRIFGVAKVYEEARKA